MTQPVDLPAHAEDNVRSIASSFEAPDWYLKGYATNIRIRTETVAVLYADKEFDHILDIGCGDGSLTLPLLPRTKRITYLDVSQAMLDIVAARIGPAHAAKADYLHAHFMEADLPVQKFDLVVSVGVLAYIDDVAAYLAKVHAVLSPGGCLLLECTDAAHFLSRLDRAYQAVTGLLRPRKFEIYQHTAAEVLQAASTRGLRLDRTFRYAYSLPILSRLIPKSSAYRFIRRTYGDIVQNRRRSLGNQCVFSLRRSD
jgi:SAM-dependent methyltransferase